MVQVHTKLLKSCGNYRYEPEPSFRYMVGKLGFLICLVSWVLESQKEKISESDLRGKVSLFLSACVFR